MAMKKQKNKKEWIFGYHSVMAVLDARPRAAERVVLRRGKGDREPGPDPYNMSASRKAVMEKAGALGVPVLEMDTREFDAMVQARVHQGMAVLAPMPETVSVSDCLGSERSAIAVLDGVTDPMNFGSILRSAEALGLDAVVIGKDRSAGMTAAAHKASSGSMEYIRIAEAVNLSRALKELKEAGYWIFGADPEAEKEIGEVELSSKTAVVIGAEGKGIRPGIKKEIDFLFKIRLGGKTSSLNASAASAIIFFQIMQGKTLLNHDSLANDGSKIAWKAGE